MPGRFRPAPCIAVAALPLSPAGIGAAARGAHPPAENAGSRVAREQVVVNGTVVTMDAARTVVERGAVAVADGRILEVGPAAEVEARHPDAERIDARGGIVL